MPPRRIHHHALPVTLHEKGFAPMSTVQTLVDSGIHFGQRRTNWNPKMARFIFGERNKIHIIDIRETLKGLLLLCHVKPSALQHICCHTMTVASQRNGRGPRRLQKHGTAKALTSTEI